MNDRLKDFIEQNRQAFDSEEPDPQLFSRIQKNLSGGPAPAKWFQHPSMKWAAAAAGVILVAGTVYLAVPKKAVQNSIAVTNPPVKTETTNEISDPAYAKQISYFREIIGLKQEELKQLKNDYPDLYTRFVTDLNQLDSSYQSLKINLAVNPNREMLLQAMLQNLQLQSELLNRQLIIINEIKQKSNNHEKNTI